jgi:hypothetical protein
MSRPILCLIQPPIQPVPTVLSLTSSGWGVELTTHLHIAEIKKEWSYTSTPPICLQESTGTSWTSVSTTVYLHVIDNTKAHSEDHVDHTKYDGELHFVWV